MILQYFCYRFHKAIDCPLHPGTGVPLLILDPKRVFLCERENVKIFAIGFNRLVITRCISGDRAIPLRARFGAAADGGGREEQDLPGGGDGATSLDRRGSRGHRGGGDRGDARLRAAKGLEGVDIVTARAR
jgi:hypothetical protein